jgi:hypothetical protein
MKLFPYRIPIQQAHPEADIARRVDFCGDLKMFLENVVAVLQSLWLSDEAYFHLNGYVNKQIMCVWTGA